MKSKMLMTVLLLGFIFVSCGGDDITPPGNGTDEPDTKFDVSQMAGKKEGKVQISLLPGNKAPIEVSTQFMITASKEETDKSLTFSFFTPDLISGVTTASGFKVASGLCKFQLGSYSPVVTTIERKNIPAFIHNWFPENDIVKMELSEVVFKNQAQYHINDKTLSVTGTMEMLLYDSTSELPLRGYYLELVYEKFK